MTSPTLYRDGEEGSRKGESRFRRRAGKKKQLKGIYVTGRITDIWWSLVYSRKSEFRAGEEKPRRKATKGGNRKGR